MWNCVHDWSKCFGRPVSGVEGVFALERAGWGDTHASNLVVVCRARVGGVRLFVRNTGKQKFFTETLWAGRSCLVFSTNSELFVRHFTFCDTCTIDTCTTEKRFCLI